MGLLFIAVIVGLIWGYITLRRWMASRDFEKQRMTLVQDKVIDQWSVLIDGGAGKGEKAIETVGAAVRDEKLPNVELSTRFIVTEDAEQRPFLCITNTRLKGYEMLVAAYDYGSRLDVVWYLVFDSPWAYLKRKIKGATTVHRRLMLERKSTVYASASTKQGYRDPETLTMSEKQELKNYVNIVHKALTGEVKKMMEGLNLDFSKVDTHTRGFVNLT